MGLPQPSNDVLWDIAAIRGSARQRLLPAEPVPSIMSLPIAALAAPCLSAPERRSIENAFESANSRANWQDRHRASRVSSHGMGLRCSINELSANETFAPNS